MRRSKRFLAAFLAAVLTLALAACQDNASLAGSSPPEETGGGGENAPASQTEDFQKNLHQSVRRTYGLPTFVETADGYYMGYGSLYYIEKETGKASILMRRTLAGSSEAIRQSRSRILCCASAEIGEITQ